MPVTWSSMGVDKNSWRYLHREDKERDCTAARKTQRMSGMSSGNFRQVRRARGKVTGCGSPPTSAYLHEPRLEDVDPIATTWRENDVSPSRRSTLPAWFEATTRPWTFLGPSVYLPLPPAPLPGFSSIPDVSLSLFRNLLRYTGISCINVYLSTRRRSFHSPAAENEHRAAIQ